MRRLILRVFYSAGTIFCRSRSIRKIGKNKNPQNFHATRYLRNYMLSISAVNLSLGFWLANLSRETLQDQQVDENVYIYAGFQFGLLFSWLLGVYCLLHLTVRCARPLHDSMLGGILKAPVLFFDTNPAGRILNRFSKDTESMDEMLPKDLTVISFFITDIFFAFLLICLTNY